MPTERIDIVISERGSRTVRRNIEKIGTGASRAGGAVRLLRRSLGALSVGLVLTGAVRTLANFSQAMSTVKAITAATADQFKRLRDTAKDLGATTRFTATQVAQGMKFLARAGFDTQQVLASIADTLNLAQAGELGLAEAADIASNVLKGFNLEAEQTVRIVNVMVNTSNRANTSVEQLGSAMSFVAPAAAAIGIEVELAAAAIGALSDAGVQATRAGTSLRMIFVKLLDPTSKARAALRGMGLSMEDINVESRGLIPVLETLRDKNISLTDAARIFGVRQAANFLILTKSIDKIKKLNLENQGLVDTAKTVAAIMDDNLNGALLRVKSAFEAVQIAIGDLGAESGLTNFFNSLASSLRALAKNLETVLPLLSAFLAGITALFIIGKVNTLLTAMGIGVAFIGPPMTIAARATALLTASLVSLRAVLAFLFGPVGLIVGAVSLLAFFATRTDTATKAIDLEAEALKTATKWQKELNAATIEGVEKVRLSTAVVLKNAKANLILVKTVLALLETKQAAFPTGPNVGINTKIDRARGARGLVFARAAIAEAEKAFLILDKAQTKIDKNAAALKKLAKVIDDETNPAVKALKNSVADFVRDLEQENAIIQLQIRGLEDQIPLLEAKQFFQNKGVKLGKEELKLITEAIKANQKLNKELDAQTDAREKLETANKKAIEALQKPFDRFFTNVQKEFGDMFTDIFAKGRLDVKSFTSFMKSAFTRLAGELASLTFTRFLSGVFSGTGIGSALGLGGGGGGAGGAGGFGTGVAAGSLLSKIFPAGASMLGPGGTIATGASNLLLSLPGTGGLSASAVAGFGDAIAGGLASAPYGIFGSLGAQALGLGGGVGGTLGGIGGSFAGGALATAFLTPFLGPAAGPVGAIVGSFLGSIFGGLFGGKKPTIRKAISPLEFDPVTGLVGTGASKVLRGGDVGLSEAGALATADLLNLILDTFGGGISGLPGRVAIFSKNKEGQANQLITEFQQGMGVGINKIFEDTEQGFQEAIADLTFQTLKAAAKFADQTAGRNPLASIVPEAARQGEAIGLTGASANVLSAIRKSSATDLAGLTSDIDFALFIDGLVKMPEAVTVAQQAIDALNKTFDESAGRATALGISLDSLEAARARELLKLTTDFDETIQKSILGFTDPFKLALDNLTTVQENRIREAKVLGANLVEIERLSGLERERLLEQQAQNVVETLTNQGDAIQGFLNKITGSTASPLAGSITLGTAESIFAEQLTLARGGDATGLVDAARNLIEVSRAQFASGEQFFQRFNFIVASLQSVLGDIPGFSHGGSLRVPGGGAIDSRLLVARVSPGELVTFSPGGGGDTSEMAEQVVMAIERMRVDIVERVGEVVERVGDLENTMQKFVRNQERQAGAPRAGRKVA